MADKFDISQHIRVESLGTRQGLLSDPYGQLTVNGISYNPENYTITSVIPETITEIETSAYIQNLGVNGILYASFSGVFITAYWKPVAGATGYKIYSLSSNSASENAQYYQDNSNFHTSYTTSSSIQLQATLSATALRRVFPVPDNRKYHILQLFALISGTYQLVDSVIVNYPQPSNVINVNATGTNGVNILKGGEWGNSMAIQWPNYEGESFYEIRAAYSDEAGWSNPNSATVILTNYISNEDLNGPAFGGGNRTYHFADACEPDRTRRFYVYRYTSGAYYQIGYADYAPYIGSDPSWPDVAREVGARRYSSSSILLGWHGVGGDIWNGVGGDIDNDERHYLIQISPSPGSDIKYFVTKENVLNAIVPDGIYSINYYPEIDVYTVKIDGVLPDSQGYRFTVWQEELNGQLTFVETYDYGIYTETPSVSAVYAYGWWPIECAATNVEIESSYNNDKGLLKTPEVGTCSVTMQGAEGDPRVNTAIQIDNKIRIKLAAAASPDATEDYLFSGFIEAMSTTYDTFGNATTTVNAVDAMSRVMNVNIPLYEFASAESFGQRMFNVFENYVAPATWGVSYDDSVWTVFAPYDGSVFPPESRENVSVSTIINELTEGEYGTMAQNRGGVIFWFNRNAPALLLAASADLTTQPNWYGFSTEHSTSSLDHFCISDFVISNKMEDITNKVVASLSYDELTTATYTDSASITKYGERSYEVQLNLDAPSANPTQYIDSWLADVPYSEDQSELESITTKVVNRSGYVTRAYQTDVTLDALRVFIQTGPVDVNGVWFAKRISHSITPENWVMTLDLTAD